MDGEGGRPNKACPTGKRNSKVEAAVSALLTAQYKTIPEGKNAANGSMTADTTRNTILLTALKFCGEISKDNQVATLESKGNM